MLLVGVDFTCAPSARKPITWAWGQRSGSVVKLDRLQEVGSLEAFGSQLQALSGVVAGFDFPLGLPRPFVEALAHRPPLDFPADHSHSLRQALLGGANATPSAAQALITSLHHYCKDRAGFQRLIDAWGQDWDTHRPAGSKLLHRTTDKAIQGLSSTSPLQTRYVPVGKMYFEGMHRLIQAQVTLPQLHQGRPQVIGFEAYPGFLSGEILGRRSYKSDKAGADEEHQARLIARMDLVDALEQGRTRLGLRLKLSPAQRDHLVSDPKGDRLDAALCMLQAAWAARENEQSTHSWGLPSVVDPVEGWILTA